MNVFQYFAALIGTIKWWVIFIALMLQVNSNGVLSFRSSFTTPSPQSLPLSTSDIIVAPFWADVDITNAGNIFYRFTNDTNILNGVEEKIRGAYNVDFSPALLFIATWDRVAEFFGFSNIVSYAVVH